MISYIKELLKTHDCVIIPGLGGLIGHYEPARRNMAAGTMAPPMKRIAFNRVLRQNDGLLINHVATSENISYDESRLKVEAFRDEVDHALQLNGSYLFNGIGKLSYDEGHHLQFFPILKENLLLDTYSLPLVVAQPVKRMSEAFARNRSVQKAGSGLAPVSDESSTADQIPAYRPWIFRAAAVIGMTFLLTTAGMSIFDGNINRDQLSILPAEPAPEGITADQSTLKLPSETDFILYEVQQPEAEVSTTDEEDAIVEEVEEPAIREVEEQPTSEATFDKPEPVDKYFIIVGSFLDHERLEREIKRMRSAGYTIETIPGPNGYTRVGLVFDGTQTNRSSELNKIRASVNKDAWLINS